MATFLLCWHKQRIIEEVDADRVDKQWYASIAYGNLDVVRIKDDKAYILDSLGAWSRVKKNAATTFKAET